MSGFISIAIVRIEICAWVRYHGISCWRFFFFSIFNGCDDATILLFRPEPEFTLGVGRSFVFNASILACNYTFLSSIYHNIILWIIIASSKHFWVSLSLWNCSSCARKSFLIMFFDFECVGCYLFCCWFPIRSYNCQVIILLSVNWFVCLTIIEFCSASELDVIDALVVPWLVCNTWFGNSL